MRHAGEHPKGHVVEQGRLTAKPHGRALACATALLASTLAALAQGPTSGALHGVVEDVSGAPIPMARIDLEDLATHHHSQTGAASDGSFNAIALAPGIYRLLVSAQGMATSQANVQVQLGGTTELVSRLQPQQVTAEITVSAPTEESAPAAATTILTSSEIASLPLDGRRWQSFAVLTPQANPATAEFDLLSFSGLAPSANSTRIDGLDDDQSYSGVPRGNGQDTGPEVEDETDSRGSPAAARGFAAGDGAGRHPGMAYTFSEAAVREFRVTGQNDSALYGHAAGGVITTVSRSGSDDRHGSLFYLVRSSAFAATDPFATVTHFRDGVVTSGVVRPYDLRQQFGGTLGGAAIPKRLFYFYAFDGQHRSFPGISSPQSATFYDLSAIQTALLGNRGVTVAKSQAALNYLDSLTGTLDRHQDQTINFGKLDWQARDHDRLSLEGNRARSSSAGGGRTAAVVNRGLASYGNSEIRVDSVIARWVHTLNNHLSNEVRLQYGRDLHLERAQTPLPQEPAISPGSLAPEVAIGPEGLIFGTPASVSQGPSPDERRSQAAEVLTWVHGRHLLQFGGDFSFVQDHVQSLANAAGTFRYDSGTTDGHAGGLVDWITDFTFSVNSYPNGGCPSINAPIHEFCFRSFSQSFGAEDTRFNTQEWAGFVQDDWRLRKGLSLSAGLRYEYEFLPLPQRPNTALDQVFSPVGATSIFPEDRNNLGPRLGLAWQPFGSERNTLRAGYGLYFGRLPGATIRSALTETALSSTMTRIRILPTDETACPQVSNQGFGYPCAFLGTPPTGIVNTTSAVLFDRRFRLPVSQQATLALEREIASGTTVRASYLLNLTRQLPNTTDINIAPATATQNVQLVGGVTTPGVRNGDVFSLPLYTQRIDTAYGPVTDILSNVNASYHALVVEASRSAGRDLQLRGSWTWSKTIDYGENSGATPSTNGQLDPFNVRYDKALSSLNYPHKLVVSAILAPQTKIAQRWTQRVASGWVVAPVLVESSGRPYSYNIFGGTRLSGGHESLNGSGGSVYLPTVGRNVLRLPEQVDLNLRLSREIPLRERTRLRFTADIFNLPNHRNISAVTERAFLAGSSVNGTIPLVFQDAAAIASEGLTTQPFGSFNGTTQGQARERQMQLGARLEF